MLSALIKIHVLIMDVVLSLAAFYLTNRTVQEIAPGAKPLSDIPLDAIKAASTYAMPNFTGAVSTGVKVGSKAVSFGKRCHVVYGRLKDAITNSESVDNAAVAQKIFRFATFLLTNKKTLIPLLEQVIKHSPIKETRDKTQVILDKLKNPKTAEDALKELKEYNLIVEGQNLTRVIRTEPVSVIADLDAIEKWLSPEEAEETPTTTWDPKLCETFAKNVAFMSTYKMVERLVGEIKPFHKLLENSNAITQAQFKKKLQQALHENKKASWIKKCIAHFLISPAINTVLFFNTCITNGLFQFLRKQTRSDSVMPISHGVFTLADAAFEQMGKIIVACAEKGESGERVTARLETECIKHRTSTYSVKNICKHTTRSAIDTFFPQFQWSNPLESSANKMVRWIRINTITNHTTFTRAVNWNISFMKGALLVLPLALIQASSLCIKAIEKCAHFITRKTLIFFLNRNNVLMNFVVRKYTGEDRTNDYRALNKLFNAQLQKAIRILKNRNKTGKKKKALPEEVEQAIRKFATHFLEVFTLQKGNTAKEVLKHNEQKELTFSASQIMELLHDKTAILPHVYTYFLPEVVQGIVTLISTGYQSLFEDNRIDELLMNLLKTANQSMITEKVPVTDKEAISTKQTLEEHLQTLVTETVSQIFEDRREQCGKELPLLVKEFMQTLQSLKLPDYKGNPSQFIKNAVSDILNYEQNVRKQLSLIQEIDSTLKLDLTTKLKPITCELSFASKAANDLLACDQRSHSFEQFDITANLLLSQAHVIYKTKKRRDKSEEVLFDTALSLVRQHIQDDKSGHSYFKALKEFVFLTEEYQRMQASTAHSLQLLDQIRSSTDLAEKRSLIKQLPNPLLHRQLDPTKPNFNDQVERAYDHFASRLTPKETALKDTLDPLNKAQALIEKETTEKRKREQRLKHEAFLQCAQALGKAQSASRKVKAPLLGTTYPLRNKMFGETVQQEVSKVLTKEGDHLRAFFHTTFVQTGLAATFCLGLTEQLSGTLPKANAEAK